jgi:hypothetical protein
MVSKRSWQAYPATYQAGAMKTIAGWIQAGESGSIIGLPGAGKSNLLGFLSCRPEVMRHYLPADFGHLALIQVDLNNLPGNDLSTFFRAILRSLREAHEQLNLIAEPLASSIEILYRRAEEKTDPFLAQSALREALLLFQEQATRLVLVLDPFDQFCETAPTQVLDNLRGLRDSFKDTLSYLIGLRHEVTYIRNPAEMGELFEIVDTHQYWLGPMEKDDARWVISQVEEALDHSFDDNQVETLIEVTGAHPGLLRAAGQWLAQAASMPAVDTWLDSLLAEASLQNRLNDLRQGLTGEEEAALSVLQRALMIEVALERQESLRQIDQKYREILTRLQIKGLCQQTDDGWHVFSPLFARFVAEMKGVSAGKICHEPATGRFFLGEQGLIGLSERDRRLLQYFLDKPRLAHAIDELIEAAWSDDDSSGVSNEAVQQAIRHLRKQIEPNPAQPCYLITERGTGYRFFPEGAPRRVK